MIIQDGSCDTLKSRKDKKRRNHSRAQSYNNIFEPLEKIKEETELGVSGQDNVKVYVKDNSYAKSYKGFKRFGFSIKFGRSSEQVAAGWPAWLSVVAGEAIDGWVPMKTESFEKMEKIGQGTYSSVYRARELQTGRIMALKKVRFDKLSRESVRFMAREIKILRRLDHPNIMKLEGIITSSLSSNIYLVFEYMEHDLSGLISSPDIKFNDSHIKCFMWQLLKGMEHCHSRGVLHRDIKSSNILVNNEGILKIADFGLANFFSTKKKKSLTNRVVTLWYRPPELLLGSTSYGTYVDMWSVGCVFAEFFIGRPLLKGRTEVEQLHKIFKLCGTPPDEYWKKSQLPLAPMFRPQYVYESTLRERCKQLPRSAVDLISTLLSVEPEKRVTARSALQAEYFYTKPFPCDPASMPSYPPNKEFDAKTREAARRKKGGITQASGGSRNPRKVHSISLITEDRNPYSHRLRDSVNSKESYDTVSDVYQTQAMSSNGSFMWETKRQHYQELLRFHDVNSRHGLQRHSRTDSFCSTEVYEPHALSYGIIIVDANMYYFMLHGKRRVAHEGPKTRLDSLDHWHKG
ncbi:probable serine/threonine-protein kinase [Tanacetum coccineum]